MYPNQQADVEPLLKAADVARRLSISRTAAYRLLQSGELSSVRFGGTVRIRPAALEKFISERETVE
jgi:excisionase family DNA binding protein